MRKAFSGSIAKGLGIGVCLLLAAGAARAREPVAATVGGVQIALAEVVAQQAHLPDKSRRQVLDLLIARELLRLEGQAQGLDREPHLAAELAQFEFQTLLQLIQDREAGNAQVEELRQRRGQTLRTTLGAALRDTLGFAWQSQVALQLIGRENARATAADSATTIASWRGGSLSVAEFLKRSRIYGVRNTLANTAQAHKAAEQLTLDDVLVAGARHRRYDREPEFRRKLRAEQSELYAQELYARQIRAQGAPGDSLLRAFYAQHRKTFQMPPGVKVREILVDDPHLADSLKTQILGGADMGALARQYTRRKWARETGGDLGLLTWQTPGYGDLIAQAFAAEPGKLQGPLQQGGLFALYRVEERVPPRQASFEEVRSAVGEHLQEEAMDRYIAQLQKKYARKIHIDEHALGE